MRGCLFVVLIGLAVLAAGAWFGTPPLAAALVRASLESAGFATVEPPEVDVSFASPGDLLSLRATTVRIVAGEGQARGMGWRDATIELHDVDLLDARFATIDADIDQPTFQDGSGVTGLGATRLTASGPSEAAATRVTISVAEFQELARGPFLARYGAAPAELRLIAPDVVSGVLLGQRLRAIVRVDSGALVLDPEAAELPVLELFRPAADLPFGLEDVTIEAGDLVVLGRLDAAAMVGR